jgi:putative ABC transport system permease protein
MSGTSPLIADRGISGRDLVGQALDGVMLRPARSALTAFGTVLGVGAIVTIVGLTGTAAAQVSQAFDALRATTVTATISSGGPGSSNEIGPQDARRAAAVNGVNAVALMWTPRTPIQATSSLLARSSPLNTTIVAATPDYLSATEGAIGSGRSFDEFAEVNSLQVAIVGSGLLSQLPLPSLSARPAIFLNGRAFTIAGVLTSAPRRPDLLFSVIVPAATAQRIWGAPRTEDQPQLLVKTDLGAAIQVARELPFAVRTNQPDLVQVAPPPDPQSLRQVVDSNLRGLLLALGFVALLIGAFGIANTTLVAVMERREEIGLRRVLGATRASIAGQFLVESTATGFVGGIVGSAVGLLGVIMVCVARQWTPVLDPLVLVVAPALGAIVGLLAGLYPALRASAIEPVEALRR